MNLIRLTRQQLADFRAALDAIGKAAERLADGGLTPEISLTETGTLLRAPSILADYVEAPMVEIDQGTDATVSVDPAPGVPVMPPREASPMPSAQSLAPTLPAATRTRPTREVSRLTTTGAGAKVIKGPFSDDERAKVRQMLMEGRSVDEIAAALNRRKQAISTLMRNPAMRQAAPAENPGKPPAAQTAAGNAGLSGPRVAPASAAPLPPGPAGPSACLAADTPGAAPHPARGDQASKPVMNGAAWRPAGAASAPAELSGEARELWHFLGQIRADDDFDIEADFDLVDGLAHGRPLAEVALDLGVDADRAKGRFRLLSARIQDDRGRVRIDGQQALLKALKARVTSARASAH